MSYFNPEILNDHDWSTAIRILGIDDAAFRLRTPDLVIAPDGKPYLYRWHVVHEKEASVYFHIQVASDPERPLHDHPWDNMSTILSGGYDEIWQPLPNAPNVREPITRKIRSGDVIYRKATEAHRLLLPDGFGYTMTLFSTGPKVREWGFWYPQGWIPYTDVTRMVNGQSVHVQPKGESDV